MEQRLHFHHAPSSAFQWVECSASVGLQEQYPDTDDEEAREGEAAHWVGAKCLLTEQHLAPLELVGHVAPNGEIITLEIAQHTALYVQFVQDVCRAGALFLGLRVEQRIKIADVLPDAFGTPDAAVFDLKNMILHIFDFKYGYGIYEAYENWQCIMYALGLLRELANHPSGEFQDFSKITVHIHIVQPRPYHIEGPVRTWVVNAKNLIPYFKRLFDSANEKTLTTKTGNHCRNCSARHVCPALAETSMVCVDQISGSTPQVTSNEALSTEITILRAAIQRAQWRLDARETEAMQRIKSGKLIPGYTIEAGKGRRAWKVPPAQVIALGDTCGIDLRKPQDVVTPAQAVDKHLDEAIVAAMSEKKTTFKLVDDRNLAKRIFGNDTTK